MGSLMGMISKVLLWCTSVISLVSSWYISVTSLVYLWYISCRSLVYLWCISSISVIYSMHFSGISQAYLRYFSYLSQKYLRSFHSYISHISIISQVSKCLLTNDMISVHLISFNILLLFMDTEIFAAYAGSCLFWFFWFFYFLINHGLLHWRSVKDWQRYQDVRSHDNN